MNRRRLSNTESPDAPDQPADLTLQELRQELEQKARRSRGRQSAVTWLRLASLALLIDEDPAPHAWRALQKAGRRDPAIAGDELYLAVSAEIAAIEGADPEPLAREIKGLRASTDPLVQFHAASALLSIGRPGKAIRHLRPDTDLSGQPRQFRWRYHSLAAYAFELHGNLEKAVEHGRQAVELGSGPESQTERLALARNLLDLGELIAAAVEHSAVDPDLLADPLDQVEHLHVLGEIEALRGNPGLALQALEAAIQRLDAVEAAGPAVYDRPALLLARAHQLADMGRSDEAVTAYQELLEAAPPEGHSLLRHELAVVLMDLDRNVEAEQELLAALQEPGYAYRPEVLAELAEVSLRMGNNDEAERLARLALEAGPLAPAYMILGNIAQDYYRLAEAIQYFEQAIQASVEGDVWWIHAQQQLAETYARMGEDQAGRLLQHARSALRYTDRRNDWYLPLVRLAERAERSLAGRQRLVN